MVEKTDGCWLWTGVRNPWGYGRFTANGRKGMVHVFAYELLVGSVPDGRELHHTCGTRHCVNPAHLEPLTRAAHRRRHADAITHCKRRHPLSGSNLRVDRSGKRKCRTCDRLRKRKSVGSEAA